MKIFFRLQKYSLKSSDLCFNDESDGLGDLGNDEVGNYCDVDGGDVGGSLLVEDGKRRLSRVPVACDNVPVIRRSCHGHVLKKLHISMADVPAGRHQQTEATLHRQLHSIVLRQTMKKEQHDYQHDD